MKVNYLLAFCAIAISAIVFFLFFEGTATIHIPLFASALTLLTLGLSLGLSRPEYPRSFAMLKVAAIPYFLLSIGACVLLRHASLTTAILWLSLIVVVWLIIANLIYKTKQ